MPLALASAMTSGPRTIEPILEPLGGPARHDADHLARLEHPDEPCAPTWLEEHLGLERAPARRHAAVELDAPSMPLVRRPHSPGVHAGVSAESAGCCAKPHQSSMTRRKRRDSSGPSGRRGLGFDRS